MTTITAQDADFGRYARLGDIPAGLLERALGWFWLGRAADQSRKNWVPGRAAGTFSASPTLADAYLRTAAAGPYLDTGIAEQAEMTVLTVARTPFYGTNKNSTWVGNATSTSGFFLGTGTSGSMLGVGYGATSAMLGAFPSGEPNTALGAINWAARSGRFGANFMRYDDLTNGRFGERTNVGAVRGLNAANTIRVGVKPEANENATADGGFVAIFAGILTDAELQRVYRIARGVEGRRGIAV